MAVLVNEEKNVKINLNFIANSFLDLKHNREDFENWIPFELSLFVEKERYEYLEENGATLTLYEIKNLIYSFDKIVYEKYNDLNIEKYEFNSSEGFFDLIVDKTYEEDQVYIEIWMNMGTYSEGMPFGYDKSFKYVVSVDELGNFNSGLKAQLNSIV